MLDLIEYRDPQYEELRPEEVVDAIKNKGLMCLIICKKGISRSGDFAKILNKNGFRSLKLQGGLEGLGKMSDEEIIKFGEDLRLLPGLFISTTRFEANLEEYKKTIKLLEQGLGKPILIESDAVVACVLMKKAMELKEKSN